MLCPFCGYESSKVLESRTTAEKTSIRRRRECESCQKRFTTYEKIELVPLLIVKKNNIKEEFSREKLFDSINKACNKCEIERKIIDDIIDSIELELSMSGKKEIPSSFIGHKILESLKNLNEIAYARYLSVFREFKSIDEFVQEIQSINKDTSCV